MLDLCLGSGERVSVGDDDGDCVDIGDIFNDPKCIAIYPSDPSNIQTQGKKAG